MSKNQTMPNIALGAWSWGTGAAGGDQIFGNHLFEEDLKPVFEAAMEKGLNLWDTARPPFSYLPYTSPSKKGRKNTLAYTCVFSQGDV